MRLITEEDLKKFREQKDTSQKDAKEINVIVKLFNPYGPHTWYIYDIFNEYHINEKTKASEIDLVWCFADLGDALNAECGSASVKELEKIRIKPFDGKIERDLYWEPTSLESVINKVKARNK